MPAVKRCTTCGETKSLDDFHRLKRSSDGRRSRCKVCACRVTREWRDANPERKRAADRAWREKNSDAARAKARAYAAAHREEARVRAREWYWANRERSLAASRAYYESEENTERIKAKVKEWRDANPERKRENDKRFRAENKERVREYQRRYRAHTAGVEIGIVDRAAAFERDHGLCGICGQPVDPTDWHLDHIIPLSRGGPHTQENIQVSHPRCNRSKGGRLSR